MVKKLIVFALLALPALPAGFEVASITPCKPGTPAPPGEHAAMVQFNFPGGRFKADATTIEFLIEWAYKIQPSQLAPVPSWMHTDRYDIVAKAEGNPTDGEMRIFVQQMLADRFKLKIHHEPKKMTVYVISKGKGEPHLSPAKEGEPRSMRMGAVAGQDKKVMSYHVIAAGFSMQQLTETLGWQLGRVLVNETGLDGDFDFTMDFTPDPESGNPLDPGVVMTAIRDLGFAMNSKTADVDYYVVDGAEKVEAGNQ